MNYRAERDPLGELKVPADAYYGIQTARAVENFRISGLRAPADLVTATVLVKKAPLKPIGRSDGSIPASRARSSRLATRSSADASAINSSSTSTKQAPAHRTT